MKRYACFTLLILLWLRPAVHARGQNSQLVNQGRRIAEQTVLHAEGLGPNRRVQVIRREDLEQRVVELQYMVKYSDAKYANVKAGAAMPVRCVEIYEVTPAGISAENGSIVSIGVAVDDVPMWLVAYDCDAKEAIPLAGFPDDESGFNNFTKALNLGAIDSETKALFVFSTFLKLSFPDFENSVVRSQLGLMRSALLNFSIRFSGTPKEFEAYWDKCPSSVRNLISNPIFSPSPKGFLVTFFTYAEGRIDRKVVLVASDGEVSQIESKSVFVWPKPSRPAD
ncbi:MAG TPA: hypothetical protein VE377_10085 [Candidatus Dormibacteraeota bacterium]|nr:hypothetical protein [Candidatus Dormibacteraeota bacterium]